MPMSWQIQTIGMPSAVQTSLSSKLARNCGSVLLVTRKFRLEVDSRKGSVPCEAVSILSDDLRHIDGVDRDAEHAKDVAGKVVARKVVG